MLFTLQCISVHTEPPTAVRNLRVTCTTSTSITIRWDPSVRTGRPDYYIVVEHTDPDDISKYIRHNKDEKKSTRYVLDNLRADTVYIIQVSVYNGVSDQDCENGDARITEVDARTREECKHAACYLFLFLLPMPLMYLECNCNYSRKSLQLSKSF